MVIPILIVSQGCRTTTYYVAKGQVRYPNSYLDLKRDSISVNCMRDVYDNKCLNLEFYFSNYKQKIGVRNVSIGIRDNKQSGLVLESIRMLPNKFTIYDSVFWASHTKSTFSALPNDYKFTKFDGENVYYYLKYQSPIIINSKELEISFFIELENGKNITFTENFFRKKISSLNYHYFLLN